MVFNVLALCIVSCARGVSSVGDGMPSKLDSFYRYRFMSTIHP